MNKTYNKVVFAFRPFDLYAYNISCHTHKTIDFKIKTKKNPHLHLPYFKKHILFKSTPENIRYVYNRLYKKSIHPPSIRKYVQLNEMDPSSPALCFVYLSVPISILSTRLCLLKTKEYLRKLFSLLLEYQKLAKMEKLIDWSLVFFCIFNQLHKNVNVLILIN